MIARVSHLVSRGETALIFPEGDRRLNVSRWGFVNAMVSSFSIAAIVAASMWPSRSRMVAGPRNAHSMGTC